MRRKRQLMSKGDERRNRVYLYPNLVYKLLIVVLDPEIVPESGVFVLNHAVGNQ
jgi:hypothetical protein